MGPIRKLLHAFRAWHDRPRAMTPVELVGLLRRMQTDRATHGEWDHFVSRALADPRLEPIRDRVAGVYGPGFDSATNPVLASAIAQAERIAAQDA